MSIEQKTTTQALPQGTVTFMFTDIEDSTRLVRDLGDDVFTSLLELHNSLVRMVLARSGGIEVTTEGDSFFAVFVDPGRALEAAIEIQREISDATWMGGTSPAVRIGLHTGNGVVGADNYVGVDVHRASRVASSGHGGQVLVSDVTAKLLGGHLPGGASLRLLGKYQLAGFKEPETIHQLCVDGLPSEFPELRTAPAASHLPRPLSEFVGRDRELGLGELALHSYRLVTLTGPGGTGKTRLSIEIARRSEPEFADGAFFVPLESIGESDLIATSILGALGLVTAGATTPDEHLAMHLADRQVLLILDNLEQLTGAASVVARLLEKSSDLKVIATSRVPLRIGGERELPVPPLDVPEPDGDKAETKGNAAVQLFASRAEAVRPGFEVNDGNVATIASIAKTLDGLPLAIELAASRVRSLTPELILERLGNQLLASASSDRPTRQQTIVNAIGWSYDLLDERTRRLFEELSVFSGGFGLAEAEAVCAGFDDVLGGVSDLVEQSLLRQTELAGEPRFRMLSVIREFGYAALAARGDEDSVIERHSTVYLDLVEEAFDEILTSRQAHWLRRLSAEHDNLRAVFDRAVAAGDGRTALRLVAAAWRFWQIRGHLVEAGRRIEEALALSDDSDPTIRANALTGLGGIIYWQGRWADTTAPYVEALDLYRLAGDERMIGEGLYNLSFSAWNTGDIAEGEALLGEALEIFERLDVRLGVGRAHWARANLATHIGEWETAVERCELAISIFEELDAPFDLGWAWFMLAHIYGRSGDVARALPAMRPALEIFGAVEDLSAMALILLVIALLMLSAGHRETAAYLAGAADRLKLDTGIAIGEAEMNQFPEMHEFVSNMSEREQARWDEGFQASFDQVLSTAMEALT